MSSKPSEHDEIIAEAREKYAVHNCKECEFRKSCNNEFDSDECKDIRQSIMLGFGIEDGYFTKLLDRLEAARKRERGATCEKSSQVGNGAKMREALAAYLALWDNGTMNSIDELKQVIKQMREALSAPPRNCDVGTAGDMVQRFNHFCATHRSQERGCDDCPAANKAACEFEWAQMPYEGGVE